MIEQTLPVEVPRVEMRAVLIRDNVHKGTLVTRLPDGGGYRFDPLSGSTAETHPRCVLVALAETMAETVCTEGGNAVGDLAYYHFCASDWFVAYNLDGPGYLLIGCGADTELPDALGEVLWDSERFDPVSPAEILEAEWIAPLKVLRDRLADGVTPELDAELAAALGTSPGFWLRLQAIEPTVGRLQALGSDNEEVAS